ncbi:hypothetical protein B7R22_17190 [Subtercola boreus]|uniref:Uncharacterized protein n=1 Tax=Subtercola boreus TaxID=120213 RepID=A0A3E0VRZ3_9MICO|nr:hypothetical protein B7R22_17190 [Subtercola boreus]
MVIEHLEGEGNAGTKYSDPVPDVPAYVEQKSKLVIDRRSTSPTAGQEVTADTFVVLLMANDVLPGSYVTVWAGTSRERRAQVITSSLFEYRRTPSHVEAYTD